MWIRRLGSRHLSATVRSEYRKGTWVKTSEIAFMNLIELSSLASLKANSLPDQSGGPNDPPKMALNEEPVVGKV